jgi:hypothetical protein
MKTYVEVKVQFYAFLASTLVGAERLNTRPSFTPRKEFRIHIGYEAVLPLNR